LHALRDYQHLITEVDQRCAEIRQRDGQYITCKKGCPGNCCQRHITVFPIEAFVFARALRQLSPGQASRIQHKARQAASVGPCPLLEDGACLMYDSRAIICRTHGYPILSQYNGHQSVGFCHRNFKDLSAIPADRTIELAPLNKNLRALNSRFIDEFAGPWLPPDRLTIAEALLLDAHILQLSFNTSYAAYNP
jgi:Fe-S-cluster containining protein